MDHWHTRTFGSGYTRESAHRSRVLADTSGNAQNFTVGTKQHLDLKSAYNSVRAVSEPQYPPSNLTLGSNDKPALQDRLAIHKARRSSHPQIQQARKWLKHPKYLDYRQRRRQDLGPDGKPVWPNFVEDSFQNAMAHIPPMGRKKKTQQGRPRGRNELISEWIYQETGVKRSRKQVSSHIQVLGKFFAGVPEWTALTAEDGNEDDGDGYGCDFYNESIADQVRIQRQLMAQAEAGEATDQLSWTNLCSQRHSLTKLNFDMWVGLPERVTQSLHNYTRLERNQEPGATLPLESFRNWRSSFPDLENILQASTGNSFDVVLVKSSFELMAEFPPQTAKLGLVLDLDFRHPTCENYQSLSALRYWSSTNHMYHNGQLLRKTGLRECQGARAGIVQPFFEAEWWATQFTKLTHKRKEAEDIKDATALTAADDCSRSLFRGLSMMQEIFASPSPGSNSSSRRRMAVLLWVFSQANKSHVGVTSWQKLVPPSNSMSTNSPSPQALETSLPPLVLDSMVDSSFDTDTSMNPFSHSTESLNTYPVSPPSYEPGEYYSGFTPFQNMSSEQLQMLDFSIENEGTSFTPKCPSNDHVQIKDEPFDFSAPLHSTASLSYLHPTATTTQDQYSSMFTAVNQPHIDTQQHHVGLIYQLPSSTGLHEHPDRRQSIANFTLNTHRLLQAQLEDYDNVDDNTCSFSQCYPHSQLQMQLQLQSQSQCLDLDMPTSAPESQSSMIHHMNDLDLDEEQMNQALLGNAGKMLNPTNYAHNDQENTDVHATATAIAHEQHPSIFDSPKLTRPPLMAHHSFAGVLNSNSTTAEHEELTFDTPTRNDFARLMTNIEHPGGIPDDDFFGHHHEAMALSFVARETSAEFMRPRSQPVLSSDNHDHDHDHVMADHTPFVGGAGDGNCNGDENTTPMPVPIQVDDGDDGLVEMEMGGQREREGTEQDKSTSTSLLGHVQTQTQTQMGGSEDWLSPLM